MTAPGGGLPTRAQILDFIASADGKVGKREIARAFNVRGAHRAALRDMLRGMADEGLAPRHGRRGRGAPGSPPPVFVAEVVAIDGDGEALAAPANWRGSAPAPRLRLAPPRRGGGRAPGVGDRVLVRRRSGGAAEVLHVIGRRPGRLVGVFERARGAEGGFVRPAERRGGPALRVAAGAEGGARPGDLVVAEAGDGDAGARVARVIGAPDRPGAISELVLERHGVPREFPADALAEAAAARPAAPAAGRNGRADLRALPLVTVDDEDARDFDDAVWAAPAEDGWRVTVAIADVAHYAPPGGALDREARRRGNSVYLPDRVVPMLPEALSNELCSLRPGEDRACLAVHLRIDSAGALAGHRFERAVMRSAARLTYREVQERGPGDPALAGPFGAYAALARARAERGTLDFDLPERRVLFDDSGAVRAIAPRPRFASHRLVEEFMIAANRAAAETLAARGAACLFRVHDRPPPDKMETLRAQLAGLGYRLAPGRAEFGGVLERARGRPEEQAVAMAVLRAQAQAAYAPRDIGHFGLRLRRYAHFTSPIRRYADLVVHRALIAALGLGGGGGALSEDALAELGEALSDAERRAAAAERDAGDRLAARFLADRVGAAFDARVVGVARFGLFVALDETGAEGLVPMRSFPQRMRFDERRRRLAAERGGAAIGLGAAVRVILEESDAAAGTLRFSPAP